MNIFLLNQDMEVNVSEYVDLHVNKMITEHTQMLLDAVHYFDPDNYPFWERFKPFFNKIKNKATPHRLHPCTIWARESRSNWLYLKRLTGILYQEWLYRRGYGSNHPHKSWDLLKDVEAPKTLEDKGLTPFAKAIQNQDYHLDCVFESYKLYYNKDKQHLSVTPVQKNFKIIDVKVAWTRREVPEWFEFNSELLKPENHKPRVPKKK